MHVHEQAACHVPTRWARTTFLPSMHGWPRFAATSWLQAVQDPAGFGEHDREITNTWW